MEPSWIQRQHFPTTITTGETPAFCAIGVGPVVKVVPEQPTEEKHTTPRGLDSGVHAGNQ